MHIVLKLFCILTLISCCSGNDWLKDLLCENGVRVKCRHNYQRICAVEPLKDNPRWFRDICFMLEDNCKKKNIIILVCCLTSFVAGHGPPQDRDSEDIAMGRKVQKVPPRRPESMSAKWCSMAKVCNHDRVPICGLSHAGDVMGFRDLCDMFDYNCIRRRNYKQTSCPADRNFLTASRKPTNTFYDE